MLHLDLLWYCQPILQQIKVKEKCIKKQNNFFSPQTPYIKEQCQAFKQTPNTGQSLMGL